MKALTIKFKYLIVNYLLKKFELIEKIQKVLFAINYIFNLNFFHFKQNKLFLIMK